MTEVRPRGFLPVLSSLLLLLVMGPVSPALADHHQPRYRRADPEAIHMFRVQKGLARDRVLDQRLEDFRRNYGPGIEQLRTERQNNIDRIRRTVRGNNAQKRLIRMENDRFKSRTALLDQRYRLPVEQRMQDIAGFGLDRNQGIDPGLGTGRTIRTPDGREIPNPRYSGESDTDLAGGRQVVDNLGRIARTHGLRVETGGRPVSDRGRVGWGNSLSINEGDPNATERGRTYFDLTINRHARQGAEAAGDRVGSQSQMFQLLSDAEDKERGLHPEMHQSPLRNAVEQQDHQRKAAEGRNLARRNGPATLLDPVHRDSLQSFGKSTKKMAAGGLSDGEIGRVIRRNGLRMSVNQFRNSLDAVHGRDQVDTTGLNRGNIQAWVNACNDVQDRSVDKANRAADRFVEQERRAVDRMRRQLNTDTTLSENRKGVMRQVMGVRRERLVDGLQRWQATTAVNNQHLNRNDGAALQASRRTGVEELPPPSQAPDPASEPASRTPVRARATVNRAAAAGYGAYGKAMGIYSKVTMGYAMYQAAQKGDYGTIGRMIFDEAVDEVKDRVMESLVPGYGQVRLAWTAGWQAGRLIGEKVKLCSDCPTVDQAVQEVSQNWHDSFSGNRAQRWEQRRMQGYQSHLNKMIDDWGEHLPEGYTRGKALEYALASEENGGNFYAALERLFDQGNQQAQEAEQQRRLVKEAQRKEAELKLKLKEAEGRAGRAAIAAQDEDRAHDAQLQTALERFRNLMAQKEREAREGSVASGQGGLGEHFDKGTKTVKDYARYEEAKKELARAKAHLAEVRRKNAERKARREREAQVFNRELAQLVQALSVAAKQTLEAYQRQKHQNQQKARRQRERAKVRPAYTEPAGPPKSGGSAKSCPDNQYCWYVTKLEGHRVWYKCSYLDPADGCKKKYRNQVYMVDTKKGEDYEPVYRSTCGCR